jgi:hypothetical protein
MPVILAPREAKIKRIMVQGQLKLKVHKTSYLKYEWKVLHMLGK